LPGGGREDGETPEQCLVREAREETELAITVERLLLDEPAPADGVYRRFHTYLCHPVTLTPNPGAEPEPEAAAVYSIAAVAWFALDDETAWGAKILNDQITAPLLRRIRAALGDGINQESGSEPYDDDLRRFEAESAAPLPDTDNQGHIENDGARIWYAAYGSGPPVILLHGGLGHSGNWGYQVPALLASGYRAIVIDSRGHGRSTRDTRPYTYERMASDVSAVMDALDLGSAALVGWSDGAVISLLLASQAPERVGGVFFFACNMDPSGAKEITEFAPILGRCINRHMQDYAQLSSTPDQFEDLMNAVGLMQRTQPNYSAQDLAQIRVPVAIVHSEHDEFIKREHAEYLARNIPNAEFIYFPGVSHFAPLQRPDLFNTAMLTFLSEVLPRE
jgi:pimeloyl-ACP methyl ester carboxylesterase/ADP-ribose pyrophosphatase YjhB (NUDIX family)